ncbi:MAG: Uma2 family endonuclease [Bryobacterales bacterium]|nr:Uma2 family endonuclease [Bryobacterales bacterium]
MSTMPHPKFTQAEYLELERAAERRSEFIDGEIVMMAGGSLRHSLVINNLQTALSRRLENSPCDVFNADLRVCIRWGKLITYPDITVLCGPPEFIDNRKDTLTNPTFLVEVLSPSTKDFDRGEKSLQYRRLPSLREYLLVDPASVNIEHYKRLPNGNWEVSEIRGADSAITLACLGCEIPVTEIYRNAEKYPA